MRRFLANSLVVLLSAASVTVAAEYRIDPVHSSATFKVRHMAVSNVRGRLGKVTGTIQWDPADITKSRVVATIDATAIDTDHPDRDKHLRSADFLDVESHPTITFKSTKVEAAGEGRLRVTGGLTIKGVTREVMLDVEGPVGPIQDPRGNTKSGATATTTINRQDFGVAWSRAMEGGGLLVGNEVAITIELELIQANDAPVGGGRSGR